MEKTISLIIPTYNERDNIAPLVQRLGQVLSGFNYEILFVDDNSGDGTTEMAMSLTDRYPVKVFVRRDRRGLATAIVDGLTRTSGQVIVVMDADLQHPPEVVPDLLRAIEADADMAVASRYVKGGGCQGWSLSRRIISRGAIILSHLLLPATRGVKDVTSGFFAVNREVVSGVELKPTGYKILLEVLMVGRHQTVAEVPFVFVTRERGKSKLNARQQIDYLKHVFSLMVRAGELARFIKFGIVGLSGVGVNVGLYSLLTRFAGFTPLDNAALGNILSGNLALTISIEMSIITNFILNNFFTFADRNEKGAAAFLKRLLNFNLLCLAGALIQVGVTNLLVLGLGLYDILSLLIAIAVAMMWNYLLNNWWTWRR